MTRAAFRQLLEEIVAVEPGALKDSDTRQSVEGWTSIVDVQIMGVISGELAVDDALDVISQKSVGDLLDALEHRGAFAAV